MPLVTKEMAGRFAKEGGWFHCCKCGCFIGEGGYLDILYDTYMGGYEEGYSTCKKHTKELETKNRV